MNVGDVEKLTSNLNNQAPAVNVCGGTGNTINQNNVSHYSPSTASGSGLTPQDNRKRKRSEVLEDGISGPKQAREIMDGNSDPEEGGSISGLSTQIQHANRGPSINCQGNTGVNIYQKTISYVQDVSTASTSTNSNPNRSRGIWFNIPEPIDSFCGREDFLSQLHDKLKPKDESEIEVTVLSQVKIVSGLGGIGKTQTARRYIMKQRKFYNNFIWVDADTENSMTNSFLKLAEEIEIPIKNSEGKPREIGSIVKEIYSKICDGGKSHLIVFDNAEDYQSCKKFFPFGLHPDLTKPVILATSRNRDWKSADGKIQVLRLDKMTDDESLEFILKQLEIPESKTAEFKEESREFIELIEGLPLALQQAVAYIKQQKKANELFNRPYKMSNYVNEFKSSAEKLQKFRHAPDSSSTVFITWDLTLNKIKEDPKGKIAIEIIELMSFLYADKIPVEFLLQLLPLPPPPQSSIRQQQDEFQPTESDFVEGLNLLEKFSMIKITREREKFVSIHRQVQFVIQQNLKNSGGLVNIFTHLIEKCEEILKNITLSKSSEIFLNMHQIVNNAFDLIPVTKKFLDFMYKFGKVLWRASRYSESLEVYRKVYGKEQALFGENHQETLSTQNDIGLQLIELGRHDEALTLLKENLEKREVLFGVDHPDTIATKHNMAGVLLNQKKYEESLELFQQVLAQNTKIQGENHPETLKTQNMIALIHSDLGDFSQALDLFEDLEKKQTEILGPHHKDVLTTKHNKARLLFTIGKFQEAKKIFNEVHEKRKEIFGENHISTTNTLEYIATILEQEGKLAEAQDNYNKVYEIRKTELGENHPDTISVKSDIATVLEKLRDQNALM